MTSFRQKSGFTIVELLVVGLILAVLLVVAVPSMGGARNSAGVQQSMSNLTAMSLAHFLYAADWNGRQVTWVRDDLGAYGGDVQVYNQAHGCSGGFDPDCHPPMIAGLGPTASGNWVHWAYWATSGNRVMFQPIGFPGMGIQYWGHFRFPNLRPFHDYLNGRYQDRVFYAPNDTIVVDPLELCLDEPPEFVAYPGQCNPAWSSYALSPAAMYHPDVWRSNAAGGWQAPWGLNHGYESPGLFQATYPDLKTHMLEHSWLQNSPGLCNPAFTGCEPYYFNHSIDSAPVTLFYDGSVRLLPNTEVLSADLQILDQTNGVDGLWHRGTPFGEEGYLIGDGFDNVPLSHHVLTTEGILGRDTLGGASPAALAVRSGVPRRARNRSATAFCQQILPAGATPFTPEEEP
ncbi:MAG: type II secretion system protein [Planctomycetota bacterium]|jgi:type II secretory pathway pseudopilin PulG